MRARVRRQGAEPDKTLIRHRVFLAATFLVFNIFFLFAGRPLLLLAPAWVQYLFDMALVATSSLWLVRNWQRSPALYSRENLAERFRRQLAKLGLDVGRFLEGRSLGDLNPDEVYVLARVLPDFGSEQRHEAYKGVVRDALAEGYVNGANSLEVLRRMRQELGIPDDEHRLLLEELGVEDPSLLDPGQRRSLEDQVRLSGYRRSLERLLRLQRQLDGAEETVGTLACRFSISPPAPRDAPSCCSSDWSRSSSACAALPRRTGSRIHGWSACWRSGCAIALPTQPIIVHRRIL